MGTGIAHMCTYGIILAEMVSYKKAPVMAAGEAHTEGERDVYGT